ncbi:MAG: ABC transporter substrate-binding protein [Pirellulaceae bacterium]
MRQLSFRPAITFALCLASSLIMSLGCDSNSADSTRRGADGKQLDRVVLMLNWYPEAEHGGFYAAKVHGYFADQGLDVEIRPGGPNSPVAQELLAGRVHFAIGNADDVLLFRQQDAQIVALMAPIQNTPRCILVREDSQVDDLRKLSGMTLQANVGRPFLEFMNKQGMLEGVQVVPYNGSVVGLVTDSKTAIQAYSFSEPLLAEQQGITVRKMMLSDVGFNPYASCLITTEQNIAERTDLVSRMVTASRAGWRKYLESPEETNAAIQADNPEGMTAEALEFGVQQLRPLCAVTSGEVGDMQADRWQQLVDQFRELELIDADKVKANDVYTTQFQ